MVKCFIEFDLNSKHLLIIVNIIFTFLIFDGEKNFYSFQLGNILCCIISFILYLQLNKEQKIEKKSEKFFSDKKNDYDGHIKPKKKQLFDCYIVFFIFIIFNGSIFIIQYLGKRIFLACRNFSLITMVLFYHFIMKKKIHFHHFICLLFILFFTSFHPYFKPRVIYGEKTYFNYFLFFKWNSTIFNEIYDGEKLCKSFYNLFLILYHKLL